MPLDCELERKRARDAQCFRAARHGKSHRDIHLRACCRRDRIVIARGTRDVATEDVWTAGEAARTPHRAVRFDLAAARTAATVHHGASHPAAPDAGRRARARITTVDNLQRVRRAPHPETPAIQHVRVNHRCPDIGVPQELLNRPDVRARFQEVRGERVAKRMTAHALH